MSLCIYTQKNFIILETMEDGAIFLDKKQLEEIKQEIIQTLEKYIDLKLKPVLSYFEKKKDFYEISLL